MSARIRIVCISDTHGMHGEIEVPAGDLLVHAGDVSQRGRVEEIRGFGRWLAGLPHRRKILVAGNHDFLFQDEPELARELVQDDSVTYLQDSGTEFEGLRIWGSPWQPWFHDWAFNLRPGEPLARVWRQIPAETDLLVTHGPPFGVLDRVGRGGMSVGCEELTRRLTRLDVKLHVFGHIHEAHGVRGAEGEAGSGPLSINASCCTLRMRPIQPAWVVDWTPGERPELVRA
jgi:Icc-related predicted phosphoesterase